MSKNKKNKKHKSQITRFYERCPNRFDPLKVQMAFYRTCHPGGGGKYDRFTGDGEAWSLKGDKVWFLYRKIKAGQWKGPWKRKLVADI
jgi:hypothetical protein